MHCHVGDKEGVDKANRLQQTFDAIYENAFDCLYLLYIKSVQQTKIIDVEDRANH